MTTTTDFEKVSVTPLFGIPLEKLPAYRRKPLVGQEETVQENKVNVALLYEILDFIEKHPTTWSQQDWFRIVDRESGEVSYASTISVVSEQNSCGASFCFAGHVALAEGFPEPPKDNSDLWTRVVVDPTWGRTEEYVQDFARKRLGITTGQADVLFHEKNTMDDLKHMVLVIATVPAVDYYDLRDIRGMDEDDFRRAHIDLIKKYN